MKIQEFPDLKQCFAFPTMAKFHYNMLAHLDDTLGLKLYDKKICSIIYPSVPAKLIKNVYEEMSMVYQILLGSAIIGIASCLAWGFTWSSGWKVAKHGIQIMFCCTQQNAVTGEMGMLQCNEGCIQGT